MAESKAMKERVCKSCGGSLYTSAKGLIKHANLCKRATEAGLVLPGAGLTVK